MKEYKIGFLDGAMEVKHSWMKNSLRLLNPKQTIAPLNKEVSKKH